MDIYWTGPFLVLLLIAYRYQRYFGYLMLWVQFQYNRAHILWTLLNKIQTGNSLNQGFVSLFIVNDTDTSAIISYERTGQKHRIAVPYNRAHVAAMSQFRVELLSHDKAPHIITQQPGIPYLVSAKQLGGYAIRIINEETGATCDYTDDTAPGYGNEVIEDE